MSDAWPLLLFFGLFFSFWLILTYNRFIKYRNMIEEYWSGIDVALKRRFNLIPNIISAVKGYSAHETEVLQKVTDQRIGSDELETRRTEESELSKSLQNVLAVAEAYPDLKANTNFLGLQATLNQVEEEIQKARERYNYAVRKQNTLVQSFPSNFVAKLFGFRNGDYFALELATQRELPEVEF